jgi:hypothetical protein
LETKRAAYREQINLEIQKQSERSKSRVKRFDEILKFNSMVEKQRQAAARRVS